MIYLFELVSARTSAYRKIIIIVNDLKKFNSRVFCFVFVDDTVADVLKNVNYYKLFEIEENASDNEIKKAYRRLSLLQLSQ